MGSLAVYPVCPLTSEGDRFAISPWFANCPVTYTRSSWVHLLQRPSDYGFDEAMLLCEESSGTWVVWIPDYGETVLDKSYFYLD